MTIISYPCITFSPESFVSQCAKVDEIIWLLQNDYVLMKVENFFYPHDAVDLLRI